MSGRVGVEQTPDIETLADWLAQHFAPEGYVTWDDRGRVNDKRRPANGNDTTMTVFRNTDGHNSMRSLTWNEIAQALAPVLADAVREARAAELREAADDLDVRLRVEVFDPQAIRDWLRDRADRIAVDAPEGVCQETGDPIQVRCEMAAGKHRHLPVDAPEGGACRWSNARGRWERVIRPGVSKEACGHEHEWSEGGEGR